MGKDLFNDRISRFSIRKLNVGVCSVLLGTLVMVGTAATAAADEQSDSNSNSVAAVTTTSEAPATATKSTYEASPAVTAPASSNATASTNDASSTSTAASIASTIATTASIEDTKPENNATEATSISADKSAQLAAGNTESNEVTAITTENSGKSRSRRSVGDPNDPNLIGDDVQDATSTPKVDKPGFTTNINAKDLASQISWLDFGDVANWTGTTTTSSGNLALQVGATYTKEIMPGYVVTIKVKSLKPFQATENYKKRLEDRGATEAEKATYDPNAKNGYIGTTNNPGANKAFKDGEEAKVIAEPQNRWTEITKEGISTGTTKKTTISAEFEGGNIGVQFEISATFRGKVVKPAIVMADGESANPGELVMFTTNGEGWQHIGEWYKNNNKSTKTYIPQDTDNLFGSNPATKIDGMNYYRTNLDILRRSYQVGPDKKAVAWKYFGSADLTTGGLGTGVFGPNISSIAAVPLVMTRGASEVGLYIASSGKQSAMLGFFPLDEGDAPASYGKAIHSIATVDGVTGKEVSQPYLGHLSPDMDENNTLDWFGDDNSATADEGVNQLLPNELKGTTNEMIKMDRTKPGNYTIALEAHTDGAAKANIYGWVDFNQNGIFDEDERSDLATITQDGTVELHFGKSKTYIDPSVTELGVRVRIAKNAAEIESPTGMAFSGEVEDFRTQITHPPKGEFKETTGPQGEKQTATVGFTARGLYKYSRTEKAKIDETVAPYIVDANGHKVTLNAEGYYVVPGQGKYKITPKGTSVDVEFIPEDHFLGTADGISIRRTDTNGYDTGWSTKFPDMEANVDTAINTMDGLYIPTVTPKDIEGESKTSTDVQGATQTGTPTFNVVGTNLDGNKVAITPSALYPAKLVDPATGQPTNALSVTVAGEGTYTIDDTTGKVTFVPEPGFTGTANGVTVTLSAPVGRDKDGTIRDEYIKTATAKYTPTVTPITVTSTDKVSADVQNVPQTQTPTFDLSNDKTAQITSKKLVDPTTGQPTDDTTVTVAGEGSYTIDPTTGAVTFTPEKDFVGTATGVTVQATATITNANGKTATITSDATYTPTVVAAVPTAQPDKSKDIQGATQTGTPTFAGTTVQVNGQDKAITIKDNSYKLLDKDGNEISTTPAYAADGTTEIGTFSIDPATGQVTFTPTDKSYTGAVTPAKVQAESSNGIKVATTYTPEIVSVSPTATSAESTDIQGATQTGKPEFQGGTVNVDGVEKTVAINEAVPATFDDGTKTKTIPNVGTYTVASDGTVTFVPEKSFVGTAPAVTVVREDMNGTKAQATYTPTVTPVKPTADPATSTGKQGQIQTGKPEFTEGNSRVPMNDRVAATFDDGSTTKTVPNVGTYTVASDGTVTFVPEKSFTGEAPVVTVVREDMNGTKAKATYTPTVILVKPTATPAESTGPQGVVQRGTVTFTEGDPVAPIDKNTITLLDENGQPAAAVFAKSPAGVIIGTFTVDKITSVVTFTPSDKSYSGEVVPVKVRAADTNGTTVETTYTPKITPVVPTAEPATSTDIQGATQTGKPTFTEGDSRVPMDDDTPATFEDGSKTKTVDGVGTYTVAADGTVTFKPLPTYVGTPEGVTVKRVDKNGTAVTAKYTPTVTPVIPSATPAVSEDVQGATQTGKPEFTAGNSRVPMNDAVPATFDDGSKTKTVDGVGTYTVATDGTVTFVPEPSFTGTAPAVTVVREDMNGTKASATYTPTVNPVTVTPTDKVSEDVQNVPQTETPTFSLSSDKTAQITSKKLVDPATGQPTDDATVTVAGEGSYTIDPTTGAVTFTPEKDFVGTAKGVTVKATATITNENGKTATITSDATYTPTVVAAVPTAQSAKSKDIQGATQIGTPTFAGTTIQVNGQDKAITIKDNSYKLLDKDGNEVTGTTPAYAADGTTVIGNFSIDSATGTVTFTPTDKSYTGAVTPAKVQAESSNGIKVDTTYTPEIVPVTPTATPAETTDIQGATQKGKPEFQGGTVTVDGVDKTVAINETVPATFDDGTTTKTVDGVGTYTVASDGTVTFVPEKSFTGEAPAVTVVREDMNGTKASATYTPTVTPVTPTATPAESTGPQGLVQTGTVTFTEGDPVAPINKDSITLLDENGQPAASVDAKSPAGDVIGTYTVDKETGVVTFTPTDKSYSGDVVPAKVQAADTNGTTVETTYTPKITPVVPSAEPATSTDIQGATQTGKPVFTEGDSRVPMDNTVPATFDDGSTTKTVDGVGTYTVASDGTVTFKPLPTYVGIPEGVTVKRVDKNGTPATAAYTPTVTPVTPTATAAETSGVQGATQFGKPVFTEGNSRVPMNDAVPATFDDGSTSKTVDGIGTYTVASDGTVTFVPDPSFTGTAPAVTVVREDKNGTKASATYTPTVNPVTLTPTNKVSEDIQNVPQTETPTFALSDDETTQITSKKLIDPTTGQPTDETTVTVAGEGTYTIDPTTGAVTYTPEKDFVGTAKGVTVQATATITNEVGKTLTITSDATYTPTVVAAVPTATPAISKDIQGATQTGTPTFAGTTVQVNGQDKPVTIKANSYKLLDKDGNEVTGTTPAYAADGTTVIGNFSIDPATGQVTFTPTDKSYTGAVTPVKVQAESSNGIKVDTTYTPEIVPVTPTATPAETTDIQGATQTGKPEFQGGTVNVDGVEKTVAINEAVPATFDDGTKTKTVPNVGTYTVAADGTVTFVPEKSFIGTAPAVTVVREDMNGTKAQATYTPTVTPVKPTGTPVTSTDIQGATQTGKPVFTEGDSRVPMDDTVPATFEDGSTTKTVDGVGTYTVAPDGTVTFKPLPTYVGTPEGVTVKRVDKNGTPATAKYTPTVTPVVPTAEPATSTDKQGQTQTGTPAFTAGNPNVPMDDTVPATFEDGSTTKTVPGEGTYTVAPDGTVTFVPEKSFTGVGTGVTVKRVDKNGTPATAKYTPTVTPVTPTATPATSEAPQGVVQTGTVTFTEGDPVAPIDKDTITLLDENGQPAASVVAKSPEGKEIGTYTVDKTTGVVTFTPTDKSYSGKVVPVKVQAKDTNGTPAETTYTPKITPVVPTAEPATSTDIQGKTQTGKPTFTPGNPAIPMDDDVPATFEDGSTSKTIPGEGTYTVAPDGTVTFVPEKSFTGTGTGVTVKRVDKNGTPATAKYTPTVTPVVPTAEPATSTDIQGKTQTGTPSFTPGNPAIPMDDDVPATFEDGSTTKTIPGEGTYTVAPDGTVTFVPEKSFTGTGTGVTVKRVDKNGTPVTAKYTPTVTPVVSTAEPATSTDIQGATQTGKPKFTEGDSRVPMNDDVPATFDDGSTTKTVDGVGTYTVAVDGTVTFVPEKSFVGTAPAVTVVREDKNGTKASATYTPTVTPVTPTGTPAVSTDVQGATQTGKPNFTEGDTRVPLNDTVPATFDDGTTTKTVPNVGTYTVAPDGTVTFVPEKSFVGTAPAVTVVREDVNGTKAQATYTPTVTPVTPTADPVASTDIQGQTQTGKPNFTPGNPSVPMDDDVPATFEDGSTTKTIPGEGTYTVAPDGTVTFVPEKSFTGKGTGVTVKRVDKNGTPVTATYTPTVTPVAPTAEPVTSIGNKGQTQTGKPVFTEGDSRVPMNDKVPATFDDGSTTKTIPGVGTYTVAPDGTVTFTPEPEFTGTAPAVTVVREDVNGTKAQATYTPTVRPITKFVDKEGKEIPGYPTVDGEEPKAKIPGYRFVETKKLPNGDFEHVYEKVTTSHVDENGKPIPGYPTEDGEQPKKDIPGYDFVKTVVDKDGNIQHIYKKTVTPSPMPTPTPQPQPKPEEPTVPVVPEAKEEVTYIDPQDPSAQLPNTGTKESSTAGLAIFSALAGLSLFGLAKRKKED